MSVLLKFFTWIEKEDIKFVQIVNNKQKVIESFDDFKEPKKNKVESFISHVKANKCKIKYNNEIISGTMCLDLYIKKGKPRRKNIGIVVDSESEYQEPLKVDQELLKVEQEVKQKKLQEVKAEQEVKQKKLQEVKVEQKVKQKKLLNDDNEKKERDFKMSLDILDDILETQNQFYRIKPTEVDLKYIGELPVCYKHIVEAFGNPDVVHKHMEWNFKINELQKIPSHTCTIYGELNIYNDGKFFVIGNYNDYKILLDNLPFKICNICDFKSKIHKCINNCTRYEFSDWTV